LKIISIALLLLKWTILKVIFVTPLFLE